MTAAIAAMDVASVILLGIAAYYVFRLGNLTGWFKAWGFIAATFIVAILLRIFFVYEPISNLPTQTLNYIRSSVNLVIAVLAYIGYTSLYRLFSKEKR
jgi:hypothetical protein